MKKLAFSALLACPAAAFSQDAKWLISAQFQPELTIYRERYNREDGAKKATLSYGGAAGLQYNVNRRFFAAAGLAYVAREFHTRAALEQNLLPPPKRSSSGEGVTTHLITYRIVSVPLTVGYKLLRTKKLTGFATAALAGNYLLNATYKSNVPRYDGTYAKNEVLGFSLSAGAGFDYHITKRVAATGNASFALLNPMNADPYLSGHSPEPLALACNLITASVGLKWAL